MDVGAVGEERRNGAVQAIVVKVEEAEVGEGSEGVEGAPEVEGREGEGGDAAVRGAEDAAPRGGACVSAGPV